MAQRIALFALAVFLAVTGCKGPGNSLQPDTGPSRDFTEADYALVGDGNKTDASNWTANGWTFSHDPLTGRVFANGIVVVLEKRRGGVLPGDKVDLGKLKQSLLEKLGGIQMRSRETEEYEELVLRFDAQEFPRLMALAISATHLNGVQSAFPLMQAHQAEEAEPWDVTQLAEDYNFTSDAKVNWGYRAARLGGLDADAGWAGVSRVAWEFARGTDVELAIGDSCFVDGNPDLPSGLPVSVSQCGGGGPTAWHGNGVASLAGGKGDNGTISAGACPGCKLDLYELAQGPNDTSMDLADSAEAVINKTSAKIINFSFGFAGTRIACGKSIGCLTEPCDEAIDPANPKCEQKWAKQCEQEYTNSVTGATLKVAPEDYVKLVQAESSHYWRRLTKAASKAEKLIITSAGNSGVDAKYDGYQWVDPNAWAAIGEDDHSGHLLAVAALRVDPKPYFTTMALRVPTTALDCYSNFGPYVQIAAPGSFLVTWYGPPNQANPQICTPNTTTSCKHEDSPTGPTDDCACAMQGTSLASPMVAGIAALIVGAAGVDLTPEQVKSRLITSAIKGGNQVPNHQMFAVNAYEAISKSISVILEGVPEKSAGVTYTVYRKGDQPTDYIFQGDAVECGLKELELPAGVALIVEAEAKDSLGKTLQKQQQEVTGTLHPDTTQTISFDFNGKSCADFVGENSCECGDKPSDPCQCNSEGLPLCNDGPVTGTLTIDPPSATTSACGADGKLKPVAVTITDPGPSSGGSYDADGYIKLRKMKLLRTNSKGEDVVVAENSATKTWTVDLQYCVQYHVEYYVEDNCGETNEDHTLNDLIPFVTYQVLPDGCTDVCSQPD